MPILAAAVGDGHHWSHHVDILAWWNREVTALAVARQNLSDAANASIHLASVDGLPFEEMGLSLAGNQLFSILYFVLHIAKAPGLIYGAILLFKRKLFRILS